MENISDIGPVVSLIGHAITAGAFLIALSMLRGFIIHGISLAIAEFFIRAKDEEQMQRMCRWFAEGDEILEHLKEIREKQKK